MRYVSGIRQVATCCFGQRKAIDSELQIKDKISHKCYKMSDEDKDIDVESDDVSEDLYLGSFLPFLFPRSLEQRMMPPAFCFDRERSEKAAHS